VLAFSKRKQTQQKLTYSFPAMADPVPEPVRAFVSGLLTAVKERNEKQIHAFYETSWNKISEKFFKTNEWPSAESVAALAENSIFHYCRPSAAYLILLRCNGVIYVSRAQLSSYSRTLAEAADYCPSFRRVEVLFLFSRGCLSHLVA
jgi:hypothetical protein